MDDTFSHDVLRDGVKPGHQFILAMVAGIITAVICALVWPVVACFAGPKLDCLALGVGALIGLSIRYSGKGTTPGYGVLAMVLALISSVAGNTLGVIASGTHEHLDIFGALQRTNLPGVIMGILSTATPMTYLLFSMGVVLAFILSVRR